MTGRENFFHSLKGPLVDWFDLGKEFEISAAMERCPLQDPFRFRARYLGFKVASLLIDEKGELDRKRVIQFSEQIEPYFLGPGREGDFFLYSHIRNCLHRLRDEPSIWGWIRKFSPPLCHKRAEEVIRETLWPEKVGVLGAGSVRKAVLMAWLTWLRQSTGSCFATAPAIWIQSQDPFQFFQDLYDLLTKGQMKRTVEGKEYTVPFSSEWGSGELSKSMEGLWAAPGIQVALEAVGASLSKVGGTAEQLFRFALLKDQGLTEEDLVSEEALARIQMTPLLAKQMAIHYQKPTERAQKVAAWKKKFKTACTAFQAFTDCALLRCWEYTIASFCDVKNDFGRWNLYLGLGIHLDHKGGIGPFLYGQIDGRLQEVNREIEGLNQEVQQESATLHTLEVMIQNATSSSRLSQLRSEWSVQKLVIDSILQRREEKVQKAEGLIPLFASLIEQYDRKLQEYFQEIFDPSLSDNGEFLTEDRPAGFRLIYKEGRQNAAHWVSIHTGEQYIQALRSFFSAIEQDLIAPAGVDGQLLADITTSLIQFIQQPAFLASAIQRAKEQGRNSPWDYVSGGTLQTLLQIYYHRAPSFTESTQKIHSETELLHFLLAHREKRALLMHSPTHAFIFYPPLLPEKAQEIFAINQERVRAEKWDAMRQEHLAHLLSDRLPEQLRALFIHRWRQNQQAQTREEFRVQLIEALGIAHAVAWVDAFLFEETPLLSSQEAEEVWKKALSQLGSSTVPAPWRGGYVGFRELYKQIQMHLNAPLFSSVDWDQKIRDTLFNLGLGQCPLLFADTNWSDWLFAFVAHPCSGALELWRVSRNGTRGIPMVDWKPWLSPENTAAWTLLTNPNEYTENHP